MWGICFDVVKTWTGHLWIAHIVVYFLSIWSANCSPHLDHCRKRQWLPFLHKHSNYDILFPLLPTYHKWVIYISKWKRWILWRRIFVNVQLEENLGFSDATNVDRVIRMRIRRKKKTFTSNSTILLLRVKMAPTGFCRVFLW